MTSGKPKGTKLHTRNIEVTTYEYDEQKIIVEGSLKDDRFQDSYLITGEKLPRGAVHHMSIRLLINCSNLLIEDIDVELTAVPRKICRNTINSLVPVKGLHITKGFTAKVKKLAGGSAGCTHLVELILAMAPAVFQGFAAHQSRQPSSFEPDQARKFVQSLVNTCSAWRDDMPHVARLKKKLNMQ